MECSEKVIKELYKKIGEQKPIVHCITNIVTAADCANMLLAIGASPTMAHHKEETAEVTEGTAALVCNLGATEDFEAMLLAGKRAAELGHPIVIDPVGIGGSTYRRMFCMELVQQVSPACIRGNYSEIRALIENHRTITGVDVAPGECADWEKLLIKMKAFAAEHSIILIASGEKDIITDGRESFVGADGDPMMTRITGSGCMSSAVLGAFLSVQPDILGAVAAVRFMGKIGEQAAAETREKKKGLQTFHDLFLDAAFCF